MHGVSTESVCCLAGTCSLEPSVVEKTLTSVPRSDAVANSFPSSDSARQARAVV